MDVACGDDAGGGAAGGQGAAVAAPAAALSPAAPPQGRLPETISMECDMVDIEAPPPPVMSDDEWDDEEDDGWLLRCFTVATGFCAGFHGPQFSKVLFIVTSRGKYTSTDF